MKKSVLLGSTLFLICTFSDTSSPAKDIGVIQLRSSPAPSVGLDGQVTFNDSGNATGANLFYDDKSSQFGLGVEEPKARLDIDGGVEASEYSIGGEQVGKNTDNRVAGKLGIGTDVVHNYPFEDDTLVLSQNNLRIQFTDNRPEQSDWRIKINDSSNGGSSFFAVFEVPKGYNGEEPGAEDTFPAPFRIESDGTTGPGQVLTVKGNLGRVGIGTSNPQSLIQVAGYIQITPKGTPPDYDCNETSERGRLQLTPSGAMHICTDSGWLTK